MESSPQELTSLSSWRWWWPSYIAASISLLIALMALSKNGHQLFFDIFNEYALDGVVKIASCKPANFYERLSILNGAFYVSLWGFISQLIALWPYDKFYSEFIDSLEEYFYRVMLKRKGFELFSSFLKANIIVLFVMMVVMAMGSIFWVGSFSCGGSLYTKFISILMLSPILALYISGFSGWVALRFKK